MLKIKDIKDFFAFLADAVVLSYSQIFFSDKKWFGFAIMLFTLINPWKTLIGISTVIIALIAGLAFNFRKDLLRSGLYTYNSLLTGIGIASLYTVSKFTILLIIFYSLLSLFLSVWLSRYFSKKGVPFLSLPFLLCIWLVHVSGASYGAFEYNIQLDKVIGFIEPFSIQFTDFINGLPLADFLHIFLKSLSAIFYIYNDLIGFLILIMILCYSRISFSLTIIGFSIGALFFKYFLGDFRILILGYIGFNFMLIAISLGGFFIVASTKSYLFQFFTITLACILLGAVHSLLTILHMPVYSLPFILVVMICISALQVRVASKGLVLVTNQQYQPEQNLYKYYYNQLRFKAQTYYQIYLPIMGEWYVSQGIKGGVTHLKDWENAWDFDLRTQENKTYQLPGFQLKDFLAYDVPVVSPVYGYVVNIADNIPDNQVGQVNTTYNWGNTVVIKVEENLYVQLSHLKMNSIKVALGEFVAPGQVIGTCGNSGRSPEPHIHFQVQNVPDIGAKTIKYPIAYYLTKIDDFHFDFHSYDYPEENETVKNIIPNESMVKAFTFIPNHTIEWKIIRKNKEFISRWKIGVDAYNKSYFYDKKYNSYAYFKNDGVLFYFYDFIGNKKSPLFDFYLVAQKILLAPYKKVKINDWILPDYIYHNALMWVQDFIAPFYQFLKGKYQSQVESVDDDYNPNQINLQTKVFSQVFGFDKTKYEAQIILKDQQFNKILIDNNQQKTTMLCLGISAS